MEKVTQGIFQASTKAIEKIRVNLQPRIKLWLKWIIMGNIQNLRDLKSNVLNVMSPLKEVALQISLQFFEVLIRNIFKLLIVLFT